MMNHATFRTRRAMHNISGNADARERAFVQGHANQQRRARRCTSPLAVAGYLKR
jgi:hypothetical protein